MFHSIHRSSLLAGPLFILSALTFNDMAFAAGSSVWSPDSVTNFFNNATSILNLNGEQKAMLYQSIGVYSLVFGTVTNLILRQYGFMLIGNALVGLLACFGGVVLYSFYLQRYPITPQLEVALIVCGVASIFALLALSAMKTMIFAFLDNAALDAFRPKTYPKPMNLPSEDDLSESIMRVLKRPKSK